VIELQHNNEPLAILLDVMNAANSSSDVRQVALQAIDRCLTHPNLAAAGVWLCDHNGMVCLGQRELEGHLSEVALACAAIMGEREQAVVPFALADGGAAHSGSMSLVMSPLIIDGAAIGVLGVVAETAPAPQERLLMQTLAAQLAAAAQRGQLRQVIDRQSQQLAAPNREWDEFLSLASHELKNPLASIKGYADLMLRRISRNAADPNRKGLEIISQQVGRTTALLEQLLDLSRIGTNRLQIVQRRADLAVILEQAVADAQATTDLHQITLDLGDRPLVGHFDEARIRQVIDAMLSNAIRYAPGGGPVVVQTRRAEDGDTAEAIVSVDDYGIGIPSDERGRVFERFFRAGNVRGLFAGMGLGLFIAREIAARHGGRMWIESGADMGTTCYVALPLK
jgi:signal transduction histidine kinase